MEAGAQPGPAGWPRSAAVLWLEVKAAAPAVAGWSKSADCFSSHKLL